MGRWVVNFGAGSYRTADFGNGETDSLDFAYSGNNANQPI
jgi:hypothetical protein